ncbi:MAG TPA: primosomal protein N' [Usitatibacter sp.]|jgi:primosomal protein N' (replication factor Y)|nr:primosomal protein N' [Usitatibacter sp.]
MSIARVALDVPIDECFDFRIPPGLEAGRGALVNVPFGRGRKVGVVVETTDRSTVPAERLRSIEAVVEDVAPFSAAELELFDFCAAYYQRPLGEVIAASLPPRLRQVSRRRIPAPQPAPAAAASAPTVELTPAQHEAVQCVLAGRDRFHPVLLHGVTGSGKTEVYLRLVADVLARGRQALLLVPEIGLTPQFEAQVRARFPGATVAAAHSHLNEGERAAAWLAAQSGAAGVVLGTRLAVLMPFRDLGLVIVDEENDASYKQQEGLRYSARDVAVRRAQRLQVPVVLGSATPSLESWSNAREGRYALARLPERAATGAAMPAVRTVDTRADRPHDGLTFALIEAIRARLARGEQSLVFVNRRGFAPVLFCRACSWHSACNRCSANLVLHLREGELRCHHCGRRERVPARCPSCGGADLAPVGQGTQRVEEALRAALPEARLARIDRDSTSRRGSLAKVLDDVRAGKVDVLVGTQMLAKGHDYAALTLVGVLDADSALFSADFRASERLFAQLVQVSGRAGRGTRPGEVLIQTDFPGHPLYAAVARHDFAAFADAALEERRPAGLPPYGHLALLRAESKKAGEATRFLRDAARLGRRLGGGVEVFDPVPAPLERKAGFERAQLLTRAGSRASLQPFLRAWRDRLIAREERRVRWSLDVDPQEV